MKRIYLPLLLAALLPGSLLGQATAALTVQANKLVTPIQPTMWGIFFEDINMGADGGIYAELVKNRSFEFNEPLMGWKELPKENRKGRLLIINRQSENPDNPRFARITLSPEKDGYGLQNEGFKGMGIKQGEAYDFSLLARLNEGDAANLTVTLSDEQGNAIGRTTVAVNGREWKRYNARLTASATSAKAHLDIWFEGKGALDIDMVSLFPLNTWKQRPGGLRADLVQLLADLKPGFLRFPGGCIVEGHELATRYQWKKTVGSIDNRRLIINRWNAEFAHRPSPDYFQSFGLGFYEYFQLAEDIGASPLPIINCGMACQFNTSEVVPAEALDPYIQDALDLIEFANGPVTTKWGKLRADMGHPAPFHLKMLGVGNEQWGPQYVERYRLFEKAIKSRYPNIKLVCSVGPGPDGPLFDFLNDTLRSLHADILDEHYYRAPQWFLENARRYDNYDRNGPKIFAGEYAAQSVAVASPENKNNWRCALSEAAFMTGLERNADVVHMASYAPLLAHVDGWQWTPDLIWFDNLRAMGTPNYYVQQLFSRNKGTHVVPILLNNQAVAGQNGLYASASIDKAAGELILKVVNAGDQPQTGSISLQGARPAEGKGTLTVLQHGNPEQANSLDQPRAVFPAVQDITLKGTRITLPLPPASLNVLRFKIK